MNYPEETTDVIKAEKHLDCDCSKVSDCDWCVLKLLRPHLMQADEPIPEYSQIQQLLRQFKQTLEHESIISLANNGKVQFIAQRAEQLLNRYFRPCPTHALPDLLHHWFQHQISQLQLNENTLLPCSPLFIKQAGQQLTIRLIPDLIRGRNLLLLEEQKPRSFSIAALESLGLTKREAEVLFWIAKDKSNAGIAKVLGCCEGTVRKHLENLYKKLGIQTRTGAVMVALERLGVLNA